MLYITEKCDAPELLPTRYARSTYLLDAVFLKLQIQIRADETTGTPMFESYYFARLRCEFSADLATPRAVYEALMQPGCLLESPGR